MNDDLMGVPWEELAAEINEQQREPLPEDGWLTSREWMRFWEIADRKEARRRLRVLDDAGMLLHSKRRQATIDERMQSVPVYKLVREESHP